MISEFIKIFLCCFAVSYLIIVYGHFFKIIFLKLHQIKLINNYELGLYGIIFLSFIALLINFFFPLNLLVNNLIFFTGIIYSIFIRNLIKKFVKISIITGFVSFLILILDHSNRPDAGLYHLPYVSILNDNKIIFGLTNVHFRFGHTSILQYLSAIFNNSLFGENGILIPISTIFSFVVIFFFKIFLKKNNHLEVVVVFFLLTYTLYGLSSYTNSGNDYSGHMFFFITFFLFINQSHYYKDLDKIKLTSLFAIYTVLLKPTLILVLLFPFFVLIKNLRNNLLIIKSTPLIFSIIFLTIFLLKNIIVSSCLIYPSPKTCISSLEWSALNSSTVSDPIRVDVASEAWAKDYPNRFETEKNYDQYISDFKWINSWLNTHFKIVLTKIIPFVAILIFVFLIFNYLKNNQIKFYGSKKDLLITFFICLLGSLIWFLKFPIYRYGLSYLIVLLITIFILPILNKTIYFNFKILKITIILIMFAVISKNLLRIYKNYDYKYIDYPWPKKNSFTENNEINTNITVYKNNTFLYYLPHPYSLCMYSKSPCTNVGNVEKDIKIKKKYTYKIYYK
jgi:hypothetical protein